jgi:prepilin-type N-terminal cleavage/methylation domain-containing protein
MQRPSSRHAFTLIEMITVIAVIAILAGLVLSLAGPIQNKGNRAKAQTDIKAMASALEAYKSDNGGVPQDDDTDELDPRSAPPPMPATYQKACLVLYKALSGDEDADGKIDSKETAKNYLPDFFKPIRLGGTKDANGNVTKVTHIQDPFAQSYGYSTAGLKAEQDYRAKLATNPNASRAGTPKGYNPTFDLWSAGGAKDNGEKEVAKWIKNWGN